MLVVILALKVFLELVHNLGVQFLLGALGPQKVHVLVFVYNMHFGVLWEMVLQVCQVRNGVALAAVQMHFSFDVARRVL